MGTENFFLFMQKPTTRNNGRYLEVCQQLHATLFWFTCGVVWVGRGTGAASLLPSCPSPGTPAACTCRTHPGIVSACVARCYHGHTVLHSDTKVALCYTVLPWSHCVTQWYHGHTVLHSIPGSHCDTQCYHGHTLLHSDTVVSLCSTVISWSHCVTVITLWYRGHAVLHSDTMVTLCLQCNLQCLSFVVDSSFLWQDFYSTGSKFHHKHDTTRSYYQVSSPNPQCHRSLCQFSWTWWPSREFRKYCNLTAGISTGKSL